MSHHAYNKRKQAQYSHRFKSGMETIRYNKFIQYLDTTPVKYNYEEDYNKTDSLMQIIRRIQENYHRFEYGNSNFSGLNPYDVLHPNDEIHDPNLYTTTEENKTNVTNLVLESLNREKVEVEADVSCIKDLLDLIEKYPLSHKIEYSINMDVLHKIKEPLAELNNMVGMTTLKNSIVDQILYYIQNLHTNNKKEVIDYMHTVIYGSPGTGKTELAKIIGKIFSNIGILKNGTFKKVTRSDLIAGFLGQTAIKTSDAIKQALGGVLFIDEAYALGNNEQRDTFSKECIDTLCEALSANKDNLMVIIAGYEDELEECFFKYNQGLTSRFTWRYKTDNYTSEELSQIMKTKVEANGWSMEECDGFSRWVDKNKEYFKSFGRDIEVLFAKSKIAYGRRVFGKRTSDIRQLTMVDFDNGLKLMKENYKNDKNKLNKAILDSLYV